MQLLIRFAYPYLLLILIPLFIAIILLKRYVQRKTVYAYPLVSYILSFYKKSSQAPAWIIYALRCTSLLVMMLLLAKPQLVDHKSKVTVEGIDIVMTLDVSGSMLCFDDLDDRRLRIDVAKEEAIRFINKRDNDAIGLVVFGQYALTRCPLTQDKTMLTSAVDEIIIDVDDPMSKGTVLAKAIVSSARRLQKSEAKSKIMILLTDGQPSLGDLPIEHALSIAKKFGIKIYTIGIGSEKGGYATDPFWGPRKAVNALQPDLLKKIAQETGGKFFEVRKPKDMARIYDEINSLETSSYQADVYARYFDYFIPLLWLVLLLFLIEICITTFIWTII